MSECSLSGRGQGHVSNIYSMYIVDIENFATASRRYTSDIHNTSVVDLFMTPIRQWKRLDRVMVEFTCLLHIGGSAYHSKSHPADEKSSLKGVWSGSGDPF